MDNESHVFDEFEDEDGSLLNPFESTRKRENYGTNSNFHANHNRNHIIPSKSLFQSYGWIFCFIIFAIVIFGYSQFGMSPRSASKDVKIVSNQAVNSGDNESNTVFDHTNNILRSPSIQPATGSVPI